MGAGDAGDLRELLQQLGADADALAPRVRRPFEPIDDRVGDDRAEELLLHPARRARRRDRRHADQHRELRRDAELEEPRGVAPHHAAIHAELRLDEIARPPRAWRRAILGVQPAGGSIGRSAAPSSSSHRPLDLGARRQLALAPHRVGRREQAAAIEIEDRLGLRLVAELGIVAAQHQNVADAQGHGAEEIALQRDAVAVAAGHLQDRLDAVREQEMRRGEAREMRLGAGAVGDVDRRGQPLSGSARAMNAAGSVATGGASSAVTTKRPLGSACASALAVVLGHQSFQCASGSPATGERNMREPLHADRADIDGLEIGPGEDDARREIDGLAATGSSKTQRHDAVGRDDVERVARDLRHPEIALGVEGDAVDPRAGEQRLGPDRSPARPSAAVGARAAGARRGPCVVSAT